LRYFSAAQGPCAFVVLLRLCDPRCRLRVSFQKAPFPSRGFPG
jgi:hypothetical protein